MDWTQAFFIIGTLGAFTFWLFTKIDNDVKAQGARIDNAMNRIDSAMNRIDGAMNRIDQMFCDMQKEIKDIYKSWDKKDK